ncbi:unnamed protein product [Mytilus edulis]|uniref:Uncharacterized protein n=1 Tax=Mytilus edulis TaxID=6550 RepID=A0A8S3UX25_MYTED|nr:unnamed protein product [Mytilus edulis]
MNGPQWILNRENWPTWTRKIEECSTMITVSDEKTDDKSTNALTQTISCIDIQRYSSLEKAIRVTAYVMRFIQNIRNSKDKRSIGFISVEERLGHLVAPARPVPKLRKPSKKEPRKPAPRVLRKPTIDYPESSDEDIIDVLLEPRVEDDSDLTITSDFIQPVVNPTSDVGKED